MDFDISCPVVGVHEECVCGLYEMKIVDSFYFVDGLYGRVVYISTNISRVNNEDVLLFTTLLDFVRNTCLFFLHHL